MNGTLDRQATYEFYISILNSHKDYYVSSEKEKIKQDISKKMRLTFKRYTTIINGLKIQKAKQLIVNHDFKSLGITKDRLKKDLEKIKKSILSNKKVKNSGIQDIEQKLDHIINIFMRNGAIDQNTVIGIMGGNDDKIVPYIYRKFEYIFFSYIDNIELSNSEFFHSLIENRPEELNPNNFIIGDNELYMENLARIILKLDKDTMKEILNHEQELKEVVWLIPFLNLMEELNVDTFKNILKYYFRIKENFGRKGIDIKHRSEVLKKIDEIINYANAYSSVDDITISALGRNIVEKVGEQNSSEYLKFYRQMLQKQYGSIPPVNVQIGDYYYESGRYSDPERLLIGKIHSGSCIDLLRSEGVETYTEVLTNTYDDVILVRDKHKKLHSRIFLFRRGNTVEMVMAYREWTSIDILKQIAEQIITQATDNNDNINFVFVNSNSLYLDGKILTEKDMILKDNRFESMLPHVDAKPQALLVGSKDVVNNKNEVYKRYGF